METCGNAYGAAMEDIPADVKAFLREHPFLVVTEAKKIKCTLNGHEIPLNLTELQKFASGKKYEKLCARANFNYSEYEPHVVPSTKQPNQLFCKLTLRHIGRMPHHVLRHVNGKRYQRALRKYNECKEKGIEFVPASLQHKKPKGGRREGRQASSRRGNEVWAPSSSEEDGSESEDSMSDLYPASMFTLKKQSEVEQDGDDDFQTVDEDEEASPMEIDKAVSEKRRKGQASGFKKKFKSRNKKRNRNNKIA
ncbi:surfeit locus protein 2 [Paramormyrops kingsleyae]|uniref:surfeit locus protein 2 n=1 Tax=Paramormyrops kingsleyae TaxID=1676925 RepID=UPI003B9711D1